MEYIVHTDLCSFKKFFSFLEPFFSPACFQILKNVLILYDLQKKFSQKFNMGIKYAEIDSNFESVEILKEELF
jgi:hypothetical protein